VTAAARGAGKPAAQTAAAIAAAVGGTLEGNGLHEVTRVAGLDSADAASLSFFADTRYTDDAVASHAGVVLVTAALAPRISHVPARIIVDVPHHAMLAALPLLHPPTPPSPGIHPTAVIGARVTMGDGVSIGAHVVIGDDVTVGARTCLAAGVVLGDGVIIGNDCTVHAGVIANSGSVLGDRVQLQAGVVLAGDGFGYEFRDGAHQKIPHVGRCIIESDVEIGANTTIDRGSVGDTVIGAGTKIDNLVQVAHNVRMGRLCLVMAQTGIAGSARIGDGVIIAGQAGLAGHITIGSGARIAAKAGVFGDVPAGETWSGYPARPHRDALRAQAALLKLPALLRRLGTDASGTA
jgi:UDP-3-O-[3-hydroxymyristoyl] glucosamine N-acyltransferase